MTEQDRKQEDRKPDDKKESEPSKETPKPDLDDRGLPPLGRGKRLS